MCVLVFCQAFVYWTIDDASSTGRSREGEGYSYMHG